jgi:hypothetical protein
MDLWNVPVKAPYAIAKASRAASLNVLVDQLKVVPKVVSSTWGKDYLPSKFKGLEGAFLHRDVEFELEAIDKIPKIAEGVFNKFFMSPWKTNKVILRPASHIRNLFSNVILNDWGGLPFYRVDVYKDAIKGMIQGHQTWKEFSRMTGSSITNYTSADLRQLSSGTEFGASIFDKILNVYDKMVSPARTLYSAEESFFKYAKYLHNLEQKMPKKEAAWDAIKWTFNFNEVTPEVARIGKWAIPFVRWYTKVIPMGIETARKHPLRMAKWIGFYQLLQGHALDQLDMSRDEWGQIEKNMPDYMQKGMYLLMPWRDDKGQFNMLDLTFMMPFFGDVSELYQRSPQQVVLQNPIFTMASTVISKRKFTGVPLYYDWEPSTTKFAKTMAYGWEQLGPAVLPFGTDWNKIADAVTEKEGALSLEAAIASAAGIKLSPVNEISNIRMKTAVMRIYDREITADMRRKMRSAKTEAEKEKIIGWYTKLRLKNKGVEPE